MWDQVLESHDYCTIGLCFYFLTIRINEGPVNQISSTLQQHKDL